MKYFKYFSILLAIVAGQNTTQTGKIDRSCNFEKGNSCEWVPYSGFGSAIKVSISRGKNTSNNDRPSFDHTLQNSRGHFAFLNNKCEIWNGEVGLRLPINEDGPMCIKFWYFIEGPKIRRLSVSVRDNGKGTIVWDRDSTQGHQWKYAQQTINFTSAAENHISFAFECGFSYQGFAAVDDIDVSEGICPSTANCYFDDNDDCGFLVENSSMQWQLQSGDESSIPDHTTNTTKGSYMYISSLDQKPGTKASMTSRQYPPMEEGCLTFWYRFGVAQSELRVSAPDDALKLTWTYRHSTWTGARISIASPTPWSVRFDAVSVEASQREVAVDDFVVEEGEKCQEPGSCDFESGMCVWENSHDDDFDWERISAMDTDSYYGPQTDHTLMSRDGTYLLLEIGKQKPGNRSIITSEVITNEQKQNSLCFSFWFAVDGISEDNNLTVEIYQKNGDNRCFAVLPTKDSYADSWQLKQIDFNADSDFQISLIAEVGKNPKPKHTIAVDDFRFEWAKCSDFNVKFPCDNGTVDGKKRCNYVTDCKDGTDEKGCWETDFEADSHSDWTIRSSADGYVWTVKEAQPFSYQIPENDQTKKDFQGHYLIAQSLAATGRTESSFTGPLVQFASPTCQLEFWFIAKGDDDEFFVQVVSTQNKMIPLWKKPSGSFLHWTLVQVPIGRQPHPFNLEFLAITTKRSKNFIAVDDIQLKDCNFPSNDSNNCENVCNNGACLNPSQVCDFTDDCGTQEFETEICEEQREENSCICNFEEFFCCWTSTGTNGFDWKRIRGSKVKGSGPFRDHTRGIPEGFLLYVQAESKHQTEGKARLVSSRFLKTEKCQIRFYYYIYEDEGSGGQLSVILRDTTTGRESVLWKRKGIMGNYFVRQDVDIVSNSTYQIIFEATAKGIALDDISFDGHPYCREDTDQSEGSIPDISSGSEETFTCLNGQTIAKTQVCNFEVDCDDSSDESKCGSCNFDNSTCGWNDISIGGTKWDLKKLGYILTNKGFAGTFLHSHVVLETEISTKTSPKCSLKLVYRAENIGGYLEIYTVPMNGNFLLKHRREIMCLEVSDPKWQTVTVRLGEVSDVKVQLIAIPKEGNKDVEIAINATQFMFCGTTQEPTDFDCTSQQKCDWSQNNPDDGAQWTWKTNGQDSHLWLPSSYPNVENDLATLSSPELKPSSKRCLVLSYRMFGSSVGSLTVFQDLSEIWTRQGSQGSSRQQAKLRLSTEQKSQIHIQGIVGKGGSGGIEIFEIKLQDEAVCNNQSDECDFETGDCGWKSVVEVPGARQWQRTQGLRNIPDHTTGTGKGYMMASFVNKSNNIYSSQFLRDPRDSTSENGLCLKMWYYASKGSDLVVFVKPDTMYHFEEILTIKGFTDDGAWRYAQTTFCPASTKDFKVKALIQGNFAQNADAIVAVDDVSIAAGTCVSMGACSFEEGMCDWRNVPNSPERDQMDWLLTNAEQLGSHLGPTDDTTIEDSSGFYLLAQSPPTTEMLKAILTSGPLVVNVENANFSFWYTCNCTGSCSLSIEKTFLNSDSEAEVEMVDCFVNSSWQIKKFHLQDTSKAFQLTISAYFTVSNWSYFAIDDLWLEHKNLPATECIPNIEFPTDKVPVTTRSTTSPVPATGNSTMFPANDLCFDCQDPIHTCLPMVVLCDGVADCQNGNDESETLAGCSSSQVKCLNSSTLISIRKVCDGTFDCEDRSDEVACKNCSEGFCKNNGLCSYNHSLECSCGPNFEGRRCSVARNSPKTDAVKADLTWVIVPVLIGISAFGFAAVVLYKKNLFPFNRLRRNSDIALLPVNTKNKE